MSRRGQSSARSSSTRPNARENRHAAGARRIPTLDEEDLLREIETRDDFLLLVLDGVQDPHNLGACLRTADGAGVLAVVAPKHRAAAITETVRKVSCGATENVPFVQVANLARTLAEWKERGVWIVGTSDRASDELFDARFTGRVALAVGAEGVGLRRLTEDTCDALVRIPMQGRVDCLNVSVAAGVCLYEAVRQRRGKR